MDIDEPPYLCWEEHHEDLTAKVQAELEEPGRLTLYFKDDEDDTKLAKIFATCSKDHLNVFTVHRPPK